MSDEHTMTFTPRAGRCHSPAPTPEPKGAVKMPPATSAPTPEPTPEPEKLT